MQKVPFESKQIADNVIFVTLFLTVCLFRVIAYHWPPKADKSTGMGGSKEELSP